MKLLRWVLAIATFYLAARLLSPLLPHTSCVDGWHSTSIGSRGACSHHGGVAGASILVVPMLFVCTLLGALAYRLPDLFRGKPRPSSLYDRDVAKRMAERYGAESGKPRPTLPGHGESGRPPYGSLEAFEAAMRRQGFAEEEIARSLALYAPSSRPDAKPMRKRRKKR